MEDICYSVQVSPLRRYMNERVIEEEIQEIGRKRETARDDLLTGRNM